jgi:hypothetical protein
MRRKKQSSDQEQIRTYSVSYVLLHRDVWALSSVRSKRIDAKC